MSQPLSKLVGITFPIGARVTVRVELVTCGLGADESHERGTDGRDGNREDDAQIVLRLAKVFEYLAAGPFGPVPFFQTKSGNRQL